MNNFEKIKQMDFEQMANFLNCIGGNPCGYCTSFGDGDCDCYSGVVGWLQDDDLNLDDYDD